MFETRLLWLCLGCGFKSDPSVPQQHGIKILNEEKFGHVLIHIVCSAFCITSASFFSEVLLFVAFNLWCLKDLKKMREIAKKI